MGKGKKIICEIGIGLLMCLLMGCEKDKKVDHLDPTASSLLKQKDENVFSWDNATVYFVITDRFKDGNEENNNSYGRVSVDATGSDIGTFHGGDLVGLTQKIKEGYFNDLGVNAIWISPPYEQIHGWIGGGSGGDFAHYGYHGYYALDFTMLDQNMGTVKEFKDFVTAAHANNIRVVMDVVMNHYGYNTLADMQTYGFGNMDGIDSSWTPKIGQNWHYYHKYINYKDTKTWSTWFGPEWIRAGIGGYVSGGKDLISLSLAGLPDIRTETSTSVSLAPILKKKWEMENSDDYKKWIIPDATDLRKNLKLAPSQYITKWLSAWVSEFGIDGFRVDTAQHVELDRWKELKDTAGESLKEWRKNNPDEPGADWEDNFWMTGEFWGHGAGRTSEFDYGFDSTINFSFQGNLSGPAYKADTMESTFASYGKQNDENNKYGLLSYISSHDTLLYDRTKLMEGGTYLMLLPGGVQIFYGDESARPYGVPCSDVQQRTRSDMNWDSMDKEILAHWQKLGQFRQRNIAVGAGQHKKIKDLPYTFSRIYDKNGISNHVIIALGAKGSTTIDVNGVFEEGCKVSNGYTGEQGVVKEGKITMDGGNKGIILLEKVGKISKK